MNAKDMLDLLRDMVFEETASHWSDVNLVRRLNIAQNKVTNRVAQSPGAWLVVSTSVTPSSSVITLPSDCAKPLYLEETSSGRPVRWLDGGINYRRVSREAGTSLGTAGSREAYPLQSTIEVNQDSYSTACTLWYQLRPPNLHCGTAASGSGASALVFAADRNLVYVDDYYNNVTVEVVDQTSSIVDIRSTISDYTASTHTAVITGTAAASDTYGTIPRLPEEVHSLIVLEAAVLALLKPSSRIDEKVLQYYLGERKEERKLVDEFLASRVAGGGTAIGDPY
uniref:Putative tail protein n=1 Tax=viral metagenome TaxID=1070528 RepID=A0A6M3L9Q5_9ZZZZ